MTCRHDPAVTGQHAEGRSFVWRCESCARLHVNQPKWREIPPDPPGGHITDVTLTFGVTSVRTDHPPDE